LTKIPLVANSSCKERSPKKQLDFSGVCYCQNTFEKAFNLLVQSKEYEEIEDSEIIFTTFSKGRIIIYFVLFLDSFPYMNCLQQVVFLSILSLFKADSFLVL